jgi:hypothetical protein
MRLKTIQCHPAAAKVTLAVLTLEFSAIGSYQQFEQHDVSCSNESSCEHARQACCPAQRLQRLLDSA